MAEQARYEELIRQFSAFGAVKREIGRMMPSECPSGSAAVLTLLGRYGDMRMSRLSELLAVDMSVTSRHVAHVAERGWIERSPDPADKRSRILRLTPAGQSLLDQLSRRTCHMLAERLGDWSDDEVAQLTALMARLRASFDDTRAHGPDPRPPVLPVPDAPGGPPARDSGPHAPPVFEQTTRTPAITK
ncbi:MULTISPECIES: MarR family winged helix-turn-helix transcriptional regulator [unclassified Streptomyces]|uniref:MarR family winged helix-turn-helix transcriptional regulator n=1 Tax=unclassified Streptomyces TaxID=2593676 RepID=UPI000F510972|nr:MULTISPECIES: MarR family winged helix-turn-helix transcriptional regulator [unclassified Streptomyces]MDH6451287.1 DNA-binding MarR family transcriptional regulator [Streptomyces sp. SAI-119]MDH6498157.1 DNA-binding MarR family transcriptional regulator [Streptomyces sp. SAI-149]QUC63031.1 winged helix-turn-helix transcriptional regulator [Streptomyces sp. A2-16]GLP70640.1 MarR family transcriptional regulator [Streptomyces sp. TUS-ST3]